MSSEPSSVRKRLAAGFGANLFSRFITSIIQLVSVPIFLKYWGGDLYGAWLLLNSVPSYFQLSDIGFGSTAGNEMSMLMAAGKQEESLDVFQSVWILTTVISSAIGALVMALVWFLPFDRWLHIPPTTITRHDTNLVILLLALCVLFAMQETLYQGAFRCVAKYAYGTVIKSFMQFAQFLGPVIAVVLHGGVVAAAAAFCLVSMAGTVFLWFMLRREVPWIRFGVRHARLETLKRLASPSISYMAFPVGNALSMQGMLLVVGHMLGPIAVVVFGTARTISRIATQVMQLINNTVWPEMSLAVGAGDFPLARRLHRHSCQIAIALGFGVAGTVALVGPTFWKHWTLGKVTIDPVLLYLMLLLVVVSSLWFTSSVALAATNRHQRIAVIYLAETAASLGAAIVLAHFFGLRGVAIALIGGESFMSASVLSESLKFLGDSFGGFVGSMFSIPRLRRTEAS